MNQFFCLTASCEIVRRVVVRFGVRGSTDVKKVMARHLDSKFAHFMFYDHFLSSPPTLTPAEIRQYSATSIPYNLQDGLCQNTNNGKPPCKEKLIEFKQVFPLQSILRPLWVGAILHSVGDVLIRCRVKYHAVQFTTAGICKTQHQQAINIVYRVLAI